MNVPFWRGRDLPPPATVTAAAAKPPPAKEIIVEPSDRWEVQVSRRPMPAYTESILTSGLDGTLYDQDQLFSTMVDTWPKLGANVRTLRTAASQAPFCVHAWSDKDGKIPEEA